MIKSKCKWLIGLIVIGFALRLLLILSTPALFEWDEAYHALVAKNMIDYPFKPMLRISPLLGFDYKAWCCNHIWLHKQPLFLWQMALSMKVFGVSIWAMRLPSLIMGVICIPLVYKIGINWTNEKRIGLIAATLCCFHNYQYGLISGRFMLDHNDMAFVFYMTCAIWALSNYMIKQNLKVATLIGFFVGCAILVKWLTALLVFGGWGLYLLLKGNAMFSSKIKHFIWAAITATIIALPWQVYITKTFPLEAAYTYSYNVMHLTKTLGHDGGYYYHIDKFFLLYGTTGLFFIFPGIFWLLNYNKSNAKINIVFFSMLVVIYLFFSLIVTTKMPAFTLPVCSLMYVILASGIHLIWRKSILANTIILILSLAFFAQPWILLKNYLQPSKGELNKIHNTKIYKSLPDSLSSYAIFNLKPYQDIDLMFHRDVNAFNWYPIESVVDSLTGEGVKMAIFKSHTNQPVPEYMLKGGVLLLDYQLK